MNKEKYIVKYSEMYKCDECPINTSYVIKKITQYIK